MSEAVAKLRAALPVGDGNGLQRIAADMVKDPAKVRVGIILFDTYNVNAKTRDDVTEAVAGIRRIEVVTLPDEAFGLRSLLRAIYESRMPGCRYDDEMAEEEQLAFEDLEPEPLNAEILDETS